MQVDEDCSLISIVISITVEGSTSRSCQFSLYIRFFQKYTVITRSSRFLIFGEMTAIAIPSTVTFTCYWHYEQVAKVHTACTIQVCLGETPDNGIVVYIFRTVSPTHSTCYWAGLNHTERSGCTREGVSVIGCTDEWIYILSVIHWRCIGLCLVATAGKHTSQCKRA